MKKLHIGVKLKHSFLILIFLICNVFSAGFDCNKAETAVEIAICSDSILSDLDSELSQIYSRIRKYLPSVRESQRSWLQFRNSVTNTDTLTTLYRERIAVLNGMKLESRNGITWCYRYLDEANGYLPVILSTPDSIVTKKVNEHLIDYGANCGCDVEGYEDGYNISSKVHLVTKDVFSIEIWHSYYCGSAYPTNAAIMSISFDLRTGEIISRGDLFEGDLEDIAEDLFSSIITPDSIDLNSIEDGDCSDVLTKETIRNYSYFDFYFSENGFVVSTTFPHVIEACNESVVVPYNRLQKWLKPNTIVGLIAPNTK